MFVRSDNPWVTGLLVLAAIMLSAAGTILAGSIGWELVFAAVMLLIIALIALKNPQILLISVLFVFTLNQTTLVGGIPFTQTARWIVLGLTAIYAVLQILSRSISRQFGSVDLVILAFILYAFVSSSYAADPEVSFQRSLSMLLLYLAVFWTAWQYADSRGEETVIKTLLISAALVYGASAAYAAFPEAWQRDGRFQGIMPNPNALGLFTSIYAPLLVWSWIKYRSLIALLLLAIAAAILFMSASRNGILSTIVGLSYLTLHIRLHRLMLIGLVMVNVAVIIFASVDLNRLADAVPVVARFTDTGSTDISSGRLDAWAAVIEQIESRPILGYGFGMDAIGSSRTGAGRFQDTGVHNSYLAITYQLGIIGLLIFVVPVVVLVVKSINSASHKHGVQQVHILQAVVIAGLVAAIFETWTHSVGNAFTLPFWVCVMLLVRRLSVVNSDEYVKPS